MSQLPTVPSEVPVDLMIRQFQWDAHDVSDQQRAGRYMTSINESGLEGFALVSAAKGAPTYRAADAFTDVFPAMYWYMHEIDAVTAGGEVIATPRTVFISRDGQTLSFVSESVIDCLADLVKYFGAGPWNPPLGLRVRQSQTRKGFRIYSLSVENVKKAK